ncbi:MAG: hypothetical protein ACLUNZ_03290 [Evtepia sp.]
MDPEIRAVILKKLNLDENETICCVSGESIAVEAAIAVKRGNVVAVEYKPGDFQTMEENLVRFGLRNVLIVDDMESYSHRWPVPDVAFLVASPKLETELKTLVHVNPKIRVVIYTLEFSFMSRIPGMLWDNGIKSTEVMKLEVSKLGRKDEIEVQPAPWIFSGQAGLDGVSFPAKTLQNDEKSPCFFGKQGDFGLDKRFFCAYNSLNQTANHKSNDGDSKLRGTPQRFGDSVSPKVVARKSEDPS